MGLRASELHVIAVISNPVRYQSRIRLFREFQERMAASGATLWVVEATFGEREPTVLDPENPRHIRVRCDHELWLKENLINVGARFLPVDARYVMWLDGDIRFERADWALETLEQLQHYDAVQPFSHVVDYGPASDILQTHTGFAYCYSKRDELGPKNRLGGHRYGGPYWHPGYAWAFRMEAWNALGGMIDRAICGAADHHMACALIGRADFSLPGTIHPHYRHMVMSWQDRAEASVSRNIGYVPGTIHHGYHGAKADRRYHERWSILTDANFDPYKDVTLDRHGVLQLSLPNDTRGRTLRDQLRGYFRARREDPV